MWWGRWGRRHCGHGWSVTAPSARWERRRPLRPFESFTFGSAMSLRKCTESGRGSELGPSGSNRFGCRTVAAVRGRARLQGLDAALHGGERAAQVGLDLLELLERVRLRLAHDVVRPGLRLAQRLLRLALDTAQDLVLLDGGLRSLVRPRRDAAGLGVRLADQALLLL